MNEDRKPRKDDAILGSKNFYPIDFLSDVFSTSKSKIQWISAAFISPTNNEIYKELLLDYFANFIKNNKQYWNEWRKEVQDIQIYLKGINFKNSTVLRSRDFSNTNLINAYFSYMYLDRCDFSNADLCQANLSFSWLNYFFLLLIFQCVGH